MPHRPPFTSSILGQILAAQSATHAEQLPWRTPDVSLAQNLFHLAKENAKNVGRPALLKAMQRTIWTHCHDVHFIVLCSNHDTERLHFHTYNHKGDPIELSPSASAQVLPALMSITDDITFFFGTNTLIELGTFNIMFTQH